MTKYREILRLKHLGFSERNIARTAGVSRNTVKRVVVNIPAKINRHSGMAETARPEYRKPL